MRRKLAYIAALALIGAAGVVAALAYAPTSAATTSTTIGNATCNASQYNPTHFALTPGQTATCTVTDTGLAAGTYTVLVKSSTGGNLAVSGTVDANGTLTFSYTFNPADFTVSVCGTTADVSISGGTIKGQQQLFFGFGFNTNSQGGCTVTTTTTETTTTATTGTTTGSTTTVTVPVTTTVTTPGGTTTVTTPGGTTTVTTPGGTTTLTTPGSTVTTPGSTVTTPGGTTTVQGPTTTVTQTVTSPTVTSTVTGPTQTVTTPGKTTTVTRTVTVPAKVRKPLTPPLGGVKGETPKPHEFPLTP